MANYPVSIKFESMSNVEIEIAFVTPKVPGLIMESSVKENVILAEIVLETKLLTLILFVAVVMLQV